MEQKLQSQDMQSQTETAGFLSKLRDYQEQAVSACLGKKHSLIVLPTGCGKSVIFAEIIRRYPCKTLIIVNKNILVENTFRYIPNAKIYHASSKKKEWGQVTIACYQSLVNAGPLPEFDLCLIDEYHRYDLQNNFFTRLRYKKLIGFTATPTCGTPPTYYKSLKEMTPKYLVPIVYSGSDMLDLTKVKVNNGEYSATSLEKAYQDINHQIADDLLKRITDRKFVVLLCSTIEHANTMAQILGCYVAHSKQDQRKEFEEKGGILCTVMMLSEGYDYAKIDCIAFLRATKSEVLYVQACGRGLRPHPEKKDCLAEGTMLLTDKGQVPIEKLTKDMRLWDGVEWVNHDGPIYKGVKNVIEHEGITATEDHKFLTREGWVCFSEIKSRKIKIKLSSIKGVPIKECDRYFRKNNKDRQEGLLENKVRDLWEKITEGILQHKEASCWMQKMRKLKKCSSMASVKVLERKKQMSKQKRQCIQKLWRAWDKISFQFTTGNGSLYNGKFRVKEGFANRQDRQQWSLRKGQHKNGACEGELLQQKVQGSKYNIPQDEKRLSRNKICRFYSLWSMRSRVNARRNNKKIQKEEPQTKRRVWDVLNSGPRNRFTANGLIVSNCLLLDYGRVIENLGDVYDIDFRDLKKKRPLARLCPMCSNLVKKTICDCGFEFYIEKRGHVERMVHLTGTSKSDVVELFDVFADKYRSKNDNDCIKIRYYSDLLTICATDYFPGWKRPTLFAQLGVKDEKEFWDTKAYKRIKKIKIKKENGYKHALFVLIIPPAN